MENEWFAQPNTIPNVQPNKFNKPWRKTIPNAKWKWWKNARKRLTGNEITYWQKSRHRPNHLKYVHLYTFNVFQLEIFMLKNNETSTTSTIYKLGIREGNNSFDTKGVVT